MPTLTLAIWLVLADRQACQAVGDELGAGIPSHGVEGVVGVDGAWSGDPLAVRSAIMGMLSNLVVGLHIKLGLIGGNPDLLDSGHVVDRWQHTTLDDIHTICVPNLSQCPSECEWALGDAFEGSEWARTTIAGDLYHSWLIRLGEWEVVEREDAVTWVLQGAAGVRYPGIGNNEHPAAGTNVRVLLRGFGGGEITRGWWSYGDVDIALLIGGLLALRPEHDRKEVVERHGESVSVNQDTLNGLRVKRGRNGLAVSAASVNPDIRRLSTWLRRVGDLESKCVEGPESVALIAIAEVNADDNVIRGLKNTTLVRASLKVVEVEVLDWCHDVLGPSFPESQPCWPVLFDPRLVTVVNCGAFVVLLVAIVMIMGDSRAIRDETGWASAVKGHFDSACLLWCAVTSEVCFEGWDPGN